MRLTLTKTAVVSKKLATEIQNFIESGFREVQIKWDSEIHRQSFIEVVDDFLLEKAHEGKIIQGKIVCDDRNNKPTDFMADAFCFDVYFKQKNALVTTLLSYLVEPEKSPLDC